MLPTSSIVAIFGFSFLFGFGAVISPGPVSAAIVANSPRHGWSVGPLVAIGHSITELFIVVMLAYGLTTTLNNPNIQIIIAILGGLMLLWMGGSMILGTWMKKIHLPEPNTERKKKNQRELISLGMVTTLSNPFWYAWWVTIAAGYLSQASSLGIVEVLAFYFGHISADFAWDTILSSVVGAGRKWITPRIYQGLVLVCGIFLGYLGLVFLLKGINYIN
jgi:threonine/homoserine/homoserine lactone efflux protein